MADPENDANDTQPTDCARLLVVVCPRVMREIRKQMRRSAEEKLTVPQFRVLVRLAQSSATNKELAEWMGVSRPTMSRMVAGLVRRAYVSSQNSASDRREICLALTKRGRSTYAKSHADAVALLARPIRNLSRERRRTLEKGLLLLKEIFCQEDI